MQILVSSITPNPEQPRTQFDEVALRELADSIRENGLQNPILVEDTGGQYTLVSGERRWRAHMLLGLPVIEATVRPATNHNGKQRLLDAVIENVQRADMNPMDEARAYRKMHTEHAMTVRTIARAVGIAYNTVSERLQLTKLEPEIQELIFQRKLSHQHAAVKALLEIPNGADRVKLAQALAAKSATVEMIISASKRLTAALTSSPLDGAPAFAIARKRSKVSDLHTPEWDALYQVNRVPPWQIFTEATQTTCERCGLRPVASDATCRACPLVEMVRVVLELARV